MDNSEFRAELERLGVSAVSRKVTAGGWDLPRRQEARRWLHEQKVKRAKKAKARLKEDREMNRAALRTGH